MPNRQSLVVANWKMNGTLKSIEPLMSAVIEGISRGTDAEVAICPPFVYISELARLLADTQIRLGAQNVSHLIKEFCRESQLLFLVIMSHTHQMELYLGRCHVLLQGIQGKQEVELHESGSI